MPHHSNVIVISSKDDLDTQINKANNMTINTSTKCVRAPKPIVIYFNQSHCPACQDITPLFVRLSLQYPSVLFLGVNADNHLDIVTMWHVNAYPTFFFLRDGVDFGTIVGRHHNQLETKVQHLAQLAA